MNPRFMGFSSSTCYLSLLRSKYPHQRLVLKHPWFAFFPWHGSTIFIWIQYRNNNTAEQWQERNNQKTEYMQLAYEVKKE